jgi:ABC-type nitrate/sulfonate/bicarbonate transport system substrate-binding protein
MKSRAGLAAAFLGVTLVAGACGSTTSAGSSGSGSGSSSAAGSGSSASAPSGASSSTPAGAPFKFNSNGTPDLSGMNIKVGNAAGSAHVGDTNVHDLVGFLKKWGANASQTNASQNAPELAVASGKLQVAVGPLPTEVDSGLVTFGPNQVHLDDELLVKPSIKSLSNLRGKTVAYCCAASPDGVLLSVMLQKAHLNKSQIHLIATGASTSSLNALIAGQVDAAFTAASGLPSAANKFHSLGSATTLIPKYADSFMAAEPSFLQSHFAEAVAVDLAWLASAKLFNSSESSWVANAKTYTSNADSTPQYQQAWHQLKVLDGWPVSQSAYSTSDVEYNLSVAKSQQALQGAGTRPAAQLIDTKAWAEAWAIFQADGSHL